VLRAHASVANESIEPILLRPAIARSIKSAQAHGPKCKLGSKVYRGQHELQNRTCNNAMQRTYFEVGQGNLDSDLRNAVLRYTRVAFVFLEPEQDDAGGYAQDNHEQSDSAND